MYRSYVPDGSYQSRREYRDSLEQLMRDFPFDPMTIVSLGPGEKGEKGEDGKDGEDGTAE